MSAILNVLVILKSYRFPPDFRGALERLFLDNVNRVQSRTRISAKPLSIKTQEYRMRKLCRSFEELRENGVDAAAKIEEIAATDINVAMQLKLQATFGLRVEESFMLRPSEAVRDADFLAVVRGTKGGRVREVPLEFKFNVLEEAARLANPYTGSMRPHGRTKTQWKDHYYYVLKCHGVTEGGLGVTSHGLRHQYLQQLYERLTNVSAPIKGASKRLDRETHRAAIQRVVEAAGHSRATKANAYLSTYRTVALLRTTTVTPQQVAAALEVAGGNKSEAAKALGISRQALYRHLKQADLHTDGQ